MKTEFVNTDEIYRQILSAPDAAARQERYLDLLVKPWKPMMDMMGGLSGGASDDPLAGARRWAWLLPDQTEQMAALLAKLEAADAWTVGREALQTAASCFEPYAGRIPFDSISGWLVLADPALANTDEDGYTGATDWTQPRFIGQFWNPNERNLPRLPGLVAHEMHHLIRNRVFPWGPGITVADYIVVEGTAESFATSLFGEENVGYFVESVVGDDLETARRVIGEGLQRTGFDVIRGYVFGDASAEKWGYQPAGVPRFGGYAVGYHVVQAFLRRTGKSIVEATFLPAEQIVRESGYFDN